MPSPTRPSPVLSVKTSAHFPKFVLQAAPIFTNFGKSWTLASILILVPLFYLKFLDRIRCLWCKNFK
jgi:hypothetical protein